MANEPHFDLHDVRAVAVVAVAVKTHVAALLLGFALAAGAAAFVIDKERTQHRSAILQIESTAQAAALATADTSRQQQAAITSKYEKALNDALQAQNTLRADASRARHQLDSLRKQTAAAAYRIALPDTSPAAVAEYATTAGELLAECSRAHQELGEKADQHAASVRLMLEAWPQ